MGRETTTTFLVTTTNAGGHKEFEELFKKKGTIKTVKIVQQSTQTVQTEAKSTGPLVDDSLKIARSFFNKACKEAGLKFFKKQSNIVWVTSKDGKSKYVYRPIPKDQYSLYYHPCGLIVKIGSVMLRWIEHQNEYTFSVNQNLPKVEEIFQQKLGKNGFIGQPELYNKLVNYFRYLNSDESEAIFNHDFEKYHAKIAAEKQENYLK